jgi:hypothetical protein
MRNTDVFFEKENAHEIVPVDACPLPLQPTRRTIRGAQFIAGALRAEARIAALSATSSAWRRPGAWAASVTGTRNSCRRPARVRSGVFIRTDAIAAAEKYHLRTQGPLTRRERWRGEFQNFSARRSIEHNAAPVTVETGKDGTQIILRSRTPKLHCQATERAVRVRRIGVHAPDHGLTWLIEGKQRATRQSHRRLNILGSAIAGKLRRLDRWGRLRRPDSSFDPSEQIPSCRVFGSSKPR